MNAEEWHKMQPKWKQEQDERYYREIKVKDKKDKEEMQILCAILFGLAILYTIFFYDPPDRSPYDCVPQYGPGQSIDCE